MRKVRIDDVAGWMGPADVKRPLGRELGTEDVAVNYFELAPGESFAFGYHRHADQEEVFYVQRGTVTFETEDGELLVEAGEAARFAPGEYQQGWNRGDERVVALAIGAPADATETEILRECADCGDRTPQRIEPTDGRDALVTLCAGCGAETGRFT
ncbi:cupin domain-containing protein [Halomarina halobia]|uniref:Cupin domain-containing protein n=1 Tax=Halomarina halobia TaxID=3033386 RepID=A0ABD6A8H7_9EURY|nr:cupin domain-containing protein [Halomarina sp. PSR21]